MESHLYQKIVCVDVDWALSLFLHAQIQHGKGGYRQVCKTHTLRARNCLQHGYKWLLYTCWVNALSPCLLQIESCLRKLQSSKFLAPDIKAHPKPLLNGNQRLSSNDLVCWICVCKDKEMEIYCTVQYKLLKSGVSKIHILAAETIRIITISCLTSRIHIFLKVSSFRKWWKLTLEISPTQQKSLLGLS